MPYLPSSLRPIVAAAAVLFAAFSPAFADEQRPNVLFIAVDDLRPQLGAYGKDFMHTPHMDRLAEQGRLFTRHYVHAPTCGAARYGLLAGQLPVERVTFTNNAFRLYQQGEAPPSFPQWFREHGYHTVQMGKISHTPDGRNFAQESREQEGDGSPEVPGAWDELVTPVGEWGDAWSAFFGYAHGQARERGESPPFEAADVDDRGYPDGLLADAAVDKLAELRDADEPFLFAVGFYKPHLPFNAPKKYWDLYDRDAIDISDVAPVARTGGEFFGNYAHDADQLDDDDYVRALRHAYYASTSYVDAQVGKVLAAVDELDLADDTIVTLWGDHGYHLGELGYWAKHTLHEHSLRAAFIVRTPGIAQPGVATDALSGTVDVYPSLVELADLPMPDHLDGDSFVPVLEDPHTVTTDHVLGFWRRGNDFTIRTDRYRLIRRGSDRYRLYDHRHDPGERHDIADDNPDLVAALAEKLDRHLDERRARD